MLSRVTCPSCGKQTLAAKTCEWCGATIVQPAPPPDPVSQGRVFPYRTATQNNRMMSCAIGLLGLLLAAFAGLSLFVGYASRQPDGLRWVPAPVPCFGGCPLLVAAVLLGVAWEFHRRAREGTVCAWCRGRLELVRIVGLNEDEPLRSHHEFYYRCTKCGAESMQVDA